ncbi:hypothetical protein E4T56_gene13574 [Termitomyces sp. T112]|nr:hypothetical protein E4T56_gene13574 [Termitomyces sp. T112]
MAQATSDNDDDIASGSPDELPPLREYYGEFKAFGWDYEPPDVVEWAAKHGYPNEIYINAMDKLAKSLPENHIRLTRVRDKKTYGDKLCKIGSHYCDQQVLIRPTEGVG